MSFTPKPSMRTSAAWSPNCAATPAAARNGVMGSYYKKSRRIKLGARLKDGRRMRKRRTVFPMIIISFASLWWNGPL